MVLSDLQLKYFLHHKWFVIDGIDGVGKSTQLALLAHHFAKKKYKTIATRALGGQPNSEQEKLRNFIFANNFSKETEEPLIAAASMMNITETARAIRQHQYPYRSRQPVVALQDRGILTHISYARARGWSKMDARSIYSDVLSNSHKAKIVNIVLLPSDIDTIFARVKKRGGMTDFHEKYENEQMQHKVLSIMISELKDRRTTSSIYQYGKFVPILVSPEDEPLDIHEAILKAIGEK